MKKLILVLLITSVFLVFTQPAHAIIYFDGDFAPGWVGFFDPTFNQGGISPVRRLAGGNPDAFFEVTNTVSSGMAGNAIWGYYLNGAYTYSPTTMGEILSINYMEDSIMFDGFGQGQAAGIAFNQNGKFYYSGGIFANQDDWTTQALNNLTAASFSTSTDPNDHPDFSSTAADIVFGFRRANSTSGTTGYSILAGIDNWKVEVINERLPEGGGVVPEPATMLLFGGGMAGAFIRRRKKA